MANSEAGDKDDIAIHVDDSCLTDSTDLQKPAQRSTSESTVIHNDQFGTDAEKNEHTEALIQAAARDIIEKIEQEAYERKHGQQTSDLSYTGDEETDSGYVAGSDLTFGQETELTYEDGTEMSCEGEELPYEAEAQDDEYDGSASSQHEDDVFSHGRTPSGGSNDSSDAQITDEEARDRLTKEIAEEIERQQAVQQQTQLVANHEDDPQEEGFFDQSCDENETPMVSRAPSYATNFTSIPEPLSTHTSRSSPAPNSTLSLCRVGSPSSMRTLQMSSPAPSIFSAGSPMCRKRPTSSRLGTPQRGATFPLKTTKITPRFAAREDPLVLLHVTVLPLRWPHGDIIENAPNDVLSKELLAVKQSWKVLKDKLGETVLERGVLIPHPQDSYEMLDERLCAALELPIRPRAKILDCGHYLGPTALLVDEDSDASSCASSDSEDMDTDPFSTSTSTTEPNTWCDVCCKDVRVGKYDKLNKVPRKRTFKVKVYASNGLMGSGAWATCWRQMEKVDVEIEPAVEPGFNMEISELFDMAMATREADVEEYQELQREGESPRGGEERREGERMVPVTPAPTYQEATRPSTAVATNQEPAYMEARAFESPSPQPNMAVRMLSPEPLSQPIVAIPVESKIRHLEDEVRRIELEEARHREIYGGANEKQQPARSDSRQQRYDEQQGYRPESPHSRTSSRMSNRSSARRHTKQNIDEDSFLDLLLAAARVLLSDRKNLLIGFLGALVVLFALKSGVSGHGGMAAVGGTGGAQVVYSGESGSAFQRQEVEMRRLQMEEAARLGMGQKAGGGEHVPYQQVPIGGGVQQVYEPRAIPVQQVIPEAMPVVQQQAIQAPPLPPPSAPVANEVAELKPAVHVQAPAAVVADKFELAEVESEAVAQVTVIEGKAEAEKEREFSIPTPPASIPEEDGIVA